MRLSWTLGLLTALLAIGLAIVPDARAADDKTPYAGNWKVTVLFGTFEDTSFIAKIEGKDGKPAISLPWVSAQIKEATAEDAKIDAKGVHFNIKFGGQTIGIAAYPSKDGNEKEPKELHGTALLRGQRLQLVLEKTDSTELDAKEARKQTDGAAEFAKALANKDNKEKEAGLKEVLEKFGEKPVALSAAQQMLIVKSNHAEKDEEVGAAVTQYAKIAAIYGPEMEQQVDLTIARTLVNADKGSGLALEYARKAEKSLDKNAPLSQTVPVLKTLAKALHKSKKDDEAKTLDARIAKLDEELDHEFEKDAIPFKPEPFKGRKADSKRVAVVELFTGAQCPPCVAADVAFDAAAQTFKPKDVLFLEYHLHIPAPDPLTNADSEARQKFYGKDIGGTPTAFINGKLTPALGGGKAKTKNPMTGQEYGAEPSFSKLRNVIEEALETDADAKLTMSLERKGDKIDVEAKVADLKKADEKKLFLHFVLLEEVVRYPGSNGQRLHHHVVRAFPGGVEGVALKEATAKPKVSIDLGDVTKTLTSYLEEANKKRAFNDDERPLNLKHLKVVAFIQDSDSKEILQAVEVDVPEATK